MSVLAVTMWQLGGAGRARELIDQASQRARDLSHAPSMTHPLLWRSHLEILRRDPGAALRAAEALEGLGREQRMPFWRIHANSMRGRRAVVSMTERSVALRREIGRANRLRRERREGRQGLP